MLKKVISGGQTGADITGLLVAKLFMLETGGTMPKGFKTLRGNRPLYAAYYGLVEDSNESYVPRTRKNVLDSDGTVRFAGNFESAGEICTLKAIKDYNKPYIDIDLTDPPEVDGFIEWLNSNNISILNVAGNAEQTYKSCAFRTEQFLIKAFFRMGLVAKLDVKQLLIGQRLSGDKVARTDSKEVIKHIFVSEK